jgi:RNA polymerase sigma-70 factor (ECF subfamily)
MEHRADRFRRLLAPHHDRALSFARSLCRATKDGDDLFQDAMLRAFAKLDSLRDDAAFRPWLYQLLINVHRSRSRRPFWRRLLPLPEPTADDEPAELYRTEGWTPGAAEANRRARAALARLPAIVREAIVLFEIEGCQVDEIAQLQRCSISAVKSRLARGREQLRALYDAEPSLATIVPQGDST